MKKILEVASKIGLEADDLILFGDNKAKIKKKMDNQQGNLILVTAMNPTPFGEGKTTVSIGLLDAFQQLNEKAVAVLREPSMGPVFGMKGGATGGGLAKVEPEEEINLHFTGDFHAITSANNLLCAAIDNHIFQGNHLNIKTVLFHRCLDMNDRALRNIKLESREEKFNITAASEIMSIFTLATSEEDLKEKLGNIIIGINGDDQPVFARELKVENAMFALLKEAFLPNLVQTLESNPVLMHGGPFANISHGCNSLVATKLGLGLAEYVITEAGFGADLGAEKFFDIMCRKANLKPKCAVLVVTMKALKYNGNCPKEEINGQNLEYLKQGLCNMNRHIENIKKYGIIPIVCINQFDVDSPEELEFVSSYCKQKDMLCSTVNSFVTGGNGSIDLAQVIKEQCQGSCFNTLYADSDTVVQKIEKVATEIYRATNVEYSEEALQKLKMIEELNLNHFPICIAKTPYSFSDNAKVLGAPEGFSIKVKDIEIYHGAGFIVILLNNIMTMPGLNSVPNYESFN